MTAGKLSVVVACPESRRTIASCLESLSASCSGLQHEILVVHDGDRELVQYVRANHPDCRLIETERETLVPVMWATGYFAASGDSVGFTTGHFTFPPEWARALIAALAGGATGAGTPIGLAPGAGVVGRAVFLLRYSAFMQPVRAGDVPDIAGDSAAYSRAALRNHEDSFANGFWETEFHRLIRREGGRLELLSGTAALIGRSYGFGRFATHRWRHGVQFGKYRVEEAGESRARIVVAAPVVPLVLLARIARRAARCGRIGDLLLSLPALTPFLLAWAAGEARGALCAHL